MSIDPRGLSSQHHPNDDLRLIERKARRLCRQPGFRSQDRLDVQQQLLLELLRRLPKFDPTVTSRERFVTMVLRRAAIDLLRHRQAEKRSAPVQSLNAPVLSDDGWAELGELVGHPEQCARVPIPDASDPGLHELCMDLEKLKHGLPPRLRALLEHLMDHPLSEASRRMGVARTTLYTAVAQLRRACERAGLRDYLGKRSSGRGRSP